MKCQKHPTEEIITRYILGELAEEDEILTGEHMAECSGCAELAAQVYSKERLIESLTPEMHGLIYLKSAMEGALAGRKEETRSQSLKERISRWIKQGVTRVGGLIQILPEKLNNMTKIITDFPGIKPSYSFTQEPSPVRSTTEVEEEYHISTATKPGIRISYNKQARVIQIRIEDSGEKPPLILFIPESEEPILVHPEKLEGTAYYGGIIMNVPANESFSFFVEPPGEK